MENSTLFLEKSIIFLPISLCALIDIPIPNGVDCSTYNQTQCIGCIFISRFFSEEKINDTKSLSHVVSVILWLITLIIGIFAMLGNIVIITVLKRRKIKHAFDGFLMTLSMYDLNCSLLAIVSSTASVVYFQNFDRGVVTLYILTYSVPLAILARSGSAFMTVVITVERYLVVAYPLKFCRWFTKERTWLITVTTAFWSLSMGIPRLSSIAIVPNLIAKDIKSIEFLDYIVVATPLEKIWYLDLYGFFDIVDYWAPLPLLILFNGLVYHHIKKQSTRRRQLTQNYQNDIQAVKMFFPVVLVLFLCNIESIIHYYFVFNRTFYRELGMGVLFFYTVNSAVNLPIYYLGGSDFRKETRELLSQWFPWIVLKQMRATAKTSVVSTSTKTAKVPTRK